MKITSNIYQFNVYREFLKDRYRQLKQADSTFSFRTFSKHAGFGSPNYLKLVMDNKRNLSEEAISKFSTGLRLDLHESEFFYYMVMFNQTQNASKKRLFEAKLNYLGELFKVKALIPELYDYYHDWYHSAIREMVEHEGLPNDFKIISERLIPNITIDQAQESIKLLKDLKFITVDSSNMLVKGESAPDASSHELHLKIHHEQMTELAAQSIYSAADVNQVFSATTLNLSAEQAALLQEKVNAFAEQIQRTHPRNPAAENIYQINVQFFALTKSAKAESKELEVVG